MLRKFMTVFLVALVGLLVACGEAPKTVTFNTQGGSTVAPITVEHGTTLELPDEPTKASSNEDTAFTFVGWFLDAEGTQAFNPATPITADITLYAKWTEATVVRFVTKTATGTIVVPSTNGVLLAEDVPAPTRTGYKFGGWFKGYTGLTWLDPTPVSFPLEVDEAAEVYAYWEPLNSKDVTYSANETYRSAFINTTPIVLNPLEYQYAHEDDFIAMLASDMYSTEVDWAKAIEDGVAEFVGDFSKIESKEFSVEALDYKYVLIGATNYPIDSFGDEHLTADGEYNRDAASTFTDTKWTYKLRTDLKFEDGTPITAHTYEYTLKQFLDPVQNNYRATSWYRDAANTGGAPILNAAAYFKQTAENPVSWDTVGFEVVDDYTFTLTLSTPMSQAAAVGYGNIRLVHPEAYEASLTADRTNSTYGNPSNLYKSYGPYVIKSWDENVKLVFNKNYDYVAKQTVTYKSQEINFVTDVQQATNLYNNGTTNVLGLSNENYAQFSEEENLKKSWDGYPQYLIFNLADSKLAAEDPNRVEHPEIMFDARFRQAFLYGFNRVYYASNVYAPNTPALLPVPADIKAYIQDPLYYNESPQHLAILEKYEIDPETYGFLPDRAKELFNEAAADYVAGGGTLPVVLKYVASNSTALGISLYTYIEESLESLFNTPGLTDKLDIQVVASSTAITNQAQSNWNFDIALLNVGFGGSSGVQWQYPAIAFMGDLIGGGSLGLTQPWVGTRGEDIGGYLFEEIEIDLSNTFAYLQELGDEIYAEDPEYVPGEDDSPYDKYVLPTYVEMFELLSAVEDDPETEEVDESKPAGIYRGDLYTVADWVVNTAVPMDGTAVAPYSGATQDIWNMVAAFEDVFFKYVTMVPTVTRSSATVYKDSVVILWPAYAGAFAWGSNRYRFLTTDADFQFGFYNSYADAYQGAPDA